MTKSKDIFATNAHQTNFFLLAQEINSIKCYIFLWKICQVQIQGLQLEFARKKKLVSFLFVQDSISLTFVTFDTNSILINSN